MSRVVRVIGTIAAGVALVAGTIATGGGLGIVAAATAGKVAAVAGVVSAVATTGSQLLAPRPVARGSPAQVVIEVEPPRPCVVGRVMTGGYVRHITAYGPTIKRVPNPYRWEVRALSGVGPCQGIVGEFFNFAPIDGFYSGFFQSVQQLGARPTATAMVPPYGAAPGWNANSKLSGHCAVGLNARFDPDGQRFASGFPVYTALVDGVFAYDPRLDSTYPGGSGPHRFNDEASWSFTRNPALIAGTYARGWFENGLRFFGLGLPFDAIDWTVIVDWANDCDANEWECNGVLEEGGQGRNVLEQRKRNLVDICAAGGGRYMDIGGVLSFDWQRPRVSLFTLTDRDLLEAGASAEGCQSLRDRFNGVRPQYVEPDNNWQQVTADEIVGTTYRTEDGQALVQTYPLNFVTNKTQAGQLAAYAMADSREFPIEGSFMAHMRFYRPGDAGTIESEILNYNGQAVINTRSLDPQSLSVGMQLKTETPGKHPFAMGRVANPPPSPIIGQTPQERDEIAARIANPRGAYRIRTYAPPFPVTPGNAQIEIVTFNGTIEDGRTITFPAETITGLGTLQLYSIFWNLVTEEYEVFVHPAVAQMESSQYVFIGQAATSDGVDFPTPIAPPPGWTGDPNTAIP